MSSYLQQEELLNRSVANLKQLMEQEEGLEDILDTAFDLYHGEGPFETIKPKQNRAELATLARTVKNEVSPQTVLEIGTADGGSLYTWARYFDSVKTIISIDKRHNELYSEFLNEFKPGHIVCLSGRSQDSNIRQEVENIVNTSGIDFILVDGGKERDEVREDYEKYSPLLNKNGIIAFHDILTHRKMNKEPDVLEVWENIRYEANSNSYELMESHQQDMHGYGVMKF